MDQKWFDEILNERIEKIKKVLSKKAGEYSSENDRLHNFKRAAALNCETPEKALAGMLTKHIVSIYDMIDGLNSRHAQTILFGMKNWAMPLTIAFSLKRLLLSVFITMIIIDIPL
jgi:hypothetical protein